MLLPEELENTPWRDPIVEEIRSIREEHAARFRFDLDAIVSDFKLREGDPLFRWITLSPQKLTETRSSS